MQRRRLITGAMLGVAALAGEWLAPEQVRPRWAARPLAQLVPRRARDWTGSDDDGDVVLPPADEQTMAQVYGGQIARVYRNVAGEEVLVVIAVAAAQDGALLIHRPESCYPSAGFAIVHDEVQMISIAPGLNIIGRYLTAENGARIEQVLYWIRIGSALPLTAREGQWASLAAALRGQSADGVLARFSMALADRSVALEQLLRFVQTLYAAAPALGQELLVSKTA